MRKHMTRAWMNLNGGLSDVRNRPALKVIEQFDLFAAL